MNNIGKVTLNTKESVLQTMPFDESVGGLLFDLTNEQDVFNSYEIIEHYFGNNQTVLIHNMEEAASFGLVDNGFLHGIPYYHISMFYKYVGKDAELYVTFSKCSNLNDEPDFSILQEIQMAASGKIFQLGVWTEQYLWEYDSKEIVFSPLVGNIQAQIDKIIGGKDNPISESFPFNVLLTSCTASIKIGNDLIQNIDYTKLPYASSMECEKVSIILGQEGSDKVHEMQTSIFNCTPVGMIGFAIGALCLASAELSFANVANFDLNKNDDILNPELGFGSVRSDSLDNNYSKMSSIHRIKQNIISLNGYIIPIGYKPKEAGVFFSSDSTLSEGNYSSLTNNRVINKCRRVVRFILLQYLHGSLIIDPATGKLSATSVAILNSAIIQGLDNYLVNQLGKSQLASRVVDIDVDSQILDCDELKVKCTYTPMGTSDEIDFIDSYDLNN